MQSVGSLSEAGTDTVASCSDELECSGSGGRDCQYYDFDYGDAESGIGAGGSESDVDC